MQTSCCALSPALRSPWPNNSLSCHSASLLHTLTSMAEEKLSPLLGNQWCYCDDHAAYLLIPDSTHKFIQSVVCVAYLEGFLNLLIRDSCQALPSRSTHYSSSKIVPLLYFRLHLILFLVINSIPPSTCKVVRL
jgi:hypothetical protein